MPTQFVFLVLPQMHLLDLSGPDQVLLEAIGYGADFRIRYCSYTDKLATTAGLPLGALEPFGSIEFAAGDFLLVPGADIGFLDSAELRRQRRLFRWIRGAREAGARIGSICSGAFVLALAGLLDGKRCTTHWKRTAELQQRFPQVNVIENVLFTEEDGIYTSAGIASGVDLALHIVGQLRGDRFAHHVARELVVYNRRSGEHPQHSVFLDYRNHIHAGIHRAQDWIQDHPDQKPTLARLAEIAAMSERTLSRTFRRETGLSVQAYVTLLRRERIEQLAKNPDLSRQQIAASCGLKSARQVSRLRAPRG